MNKQREHKEASERFDGYLLDIVAKIEEQIQDEASLARRGVDNVASEMEELLIAFAKEWSMQRCEGCDRWMAGAVITDECDRCAVVQHESEYDVDVFDI